MDICAGAHAYMKAGGWPQVVSITDHLILQHLSLDLEVAVLARLTGQPVAQTWEHMVSYLTFTLIWGIRTRVLMLAQ